MSNTVTNRSSNDSVVKVDSEKKESIGAVSRRNEWVYVVYKALSQAVFDRALFILFLMYKGFDPYKIGILQGVFFLSNIVTEVPAGIMGDKVGRKVSVALGLLAYCIYALGVVFSDSFISFIFLYATLGVALSLISGSDIALVYDSLAYDNRTHDFNRVQIRANALGTMSLALAILAGGALQKVSWDAVYLAFLVAQIFALVVWLFVHEFNVSTEQVNQNNSEIASGFVDKKSKNDDQLSNNLTKELLLFIKKNGNAVVFPILGVAVFSACTSPLFTFSQALFERNGFSVEQVAYVYCLSQIAIALVFVLMQKFATNLTFYNTALTSTALTAVAVAMVYFNNTWANLGCFIFVMLINPVVTIVSNDYFNRRVPGKIRASFLSVVGFSMSVFIALAYFSYGYLLQYFPINSVMAITSIIAAVSFLIFWVSRSLAKNFDRSAGGDSKC